MSNIEQESGVNWNLVVGAATTLTLVTVILAATVVWVWRRRRPQAMPPEAVEGILRTTTEEVKFLWMPWDSDSLFSALAHQIQGLPKESKNYLDAAIVRKMVCEELKSWPQVYDYQIVEAIALHGDRYAHLPSQEAQIQKYLEDLQMPGFPGDCEVIQAMANIKVLHVNIYPADGRRFMIFAKKHHKVRIIYLARMQRVEEGLVRYYYGSVISQFKLRAIPLTNY